MFCASALVARWPILLVVPACLASGCVADTSEQPPICQAAPSAVFSPVVRDDDASTAGAALLEIEVRPVEGLGTVVVREAPPGDAPTFSFPYRLAPLITSLAGGELTITARDATGTLLARATQPLVASDQGCMVSLNFIELELD